MSFAYYGVYAQYYEVGRVELLRSLGLTYKKLEDMGFALPVVILKTSLMLNLLITSKLSSVFASISLIFLDNELPERI